MAKCFLHIGTHKTGTTSIQWILHNHRVELASRGLLYPETGVPAGFFGHHNIAWELDGSPRFDPQYGTIEELIEETSRSTQDIILSSEDFSTSFPYFARFQPFVERLKHSGLHVVIVVYFRNMHEFVRSGYFEILKTGCPAPFTTYLSVMTGSAALRFGMDTWRLGPDMVDTFQRLSADKDIEIVARSYDRAASAIVADFLSVVGLTPADLGIGRETRLNERPGLGDALLLFFRNWKGRPADDCEAHLISWLAAALDDEDIHISNMARQMLSAKHASQNEFLKSHYGLVELIDSAARPVDLVAGPDDRPTMDEIFSIAMSRFITEAARKLAAEQSTVTCAYERVATERDALSQAHNVLIAERDALSQANNELMAERDGLLRTRDDLIAERDTVMRDRDAAIVERAAILASRSWRMTGPLRELRKLLERILHSL